MNYAELANSGVREQPVYEPGKPIEAVARDHGLQPSAIAKLASNENPFGPSPKALEAAREAAATAHLYPDGGCSRLRAKIAGAREVGEDSILVGNGSNELIELLGHAFLRPGVEAVMGDRSFVVYKMIAQLFGARAVEVPMRGFAHDLEAMADAVTERTRLVFVASPNNPTGGANGEEELYAFAAKLPEHVIFCFDEAYAEYQERPPDLRPLLRAGRKVLCLRTFSKIHGLAGFRVGYGYADPALIGLLHRVRQPFNVNSIAQAAAEAALDDAAFVETCRRANEEGRKVLCEGLEQLGLETYGGAANFVLCRVGDADSVFLELQQRGWIVRPLGGCGMPEYVRITIGRPEQNRRLLETMAGLFGTAGAGKRG